MTPLTEDLSILKHPEHGEMGFRKVRGRDVPFSADLGVGGYFSNIIIARIRKQKPCNVIICGEPGISKTYTAVGFAKYIEPTFTKKQIGMTYAEVMQLMINLPEGRIIVMDEPEYVAGHREWYKDVNKVLVSTLRSGRFKVHPLFIPTINKALLDKVIRRYLLQYMIWMTDRGEGNVYRIQPSRFTDDVWYKPVCEIYIEILDGNVCQEPWCYSCIKFRMKECHLLRAQYEKKREDIQNQRYREDLEVVQRREAKVLTDKDMEEMTFKLKDSLKYTQKGFPEPIHLVMLFEEVYGLKISNSKATQIIKRTLLRHPEMEKHK